MKPSDSWKHLVPDHLRKLGPYTPGKPIKQAEKESGVACIKMASNENPFGPSPQALEAMHHAALESNLYPDNDATELRVQLARRNGLEPDQVLVTDGSTVLLDLIARTLLAPSLNAVTSARSFIVYLIATRAAGGELIEVPMRGDSYDLDAIADAVNEDTRVVYLANPNNPTGTLFDAAATRRFLDRVPQSVFVVIDEAYYDFATHFAKQRNVDYSHSLDYVREGRPVIVLRTFSKAHGLAGLRVGYGFGPPEILAYLERLRTAFSVSAVAEAAAIAALDDTEHIRKTLENNDQGVQYLAEKLKGLGYQPVPTWANFIYFDVGGDAAALAKRIQAEGVIVRSLAPWGISTAIRVTVGTPEQNQRFIAALAKATDRATVQ
ncbi:MAG: histidinol-phosphate transaminase [Candidatus Koribacter versatilis]|uniref:Histidinol-phosphate aminotransferase n=1 Tax=Candidatus Korobacter versatilis TaxID=658062 RepID=A0A932AA10_9BACT|nr:histidinol-phosphate transaminase [Candidatus Koribacter versatilis]